jgi:hypothetical protein
MRVIEFQVLSRLAFVGFATTKVMASPRPPAMQDCLLQRYALFNSTKV